MSIEKIKETIRYIDENGVLRPYLNNEFSVGDQEIDAAEKRIGSALPESYNYFLRAYGAVDVQGVEFYGLIPDRIDYEGVPNALWLTLKKREILDFPTFLFIVENLDGGNYACLNLSVLVEGECPVVLWDMGGNNEPLHILAESFGDYFHDRIRAACSEYF